MRAPAEYDRLPRNDAGRCDTSRAPVCCAASLQWAHLRLYHRVLKDLMAVSSKGTVIRPMSATPERAWPIVGLAIILPLIFATFTQHAWEDYFITLRSSRNLVEGH